MPATLLLVDDNAIQAATRQAILKRSGHLVLVSLTPERALEQLRNQQATATPIDLLLTDHLMPGMDGVAFITAVRTFAPTLPVLVISGMAEAEREYAALSVHFRVKPIPPPMLLATIEAILNPLHPSMDSGLPG